MTRSESSAFIMAMSRDARFEKLIGGVWGWHT